MGFDFVGDTTTGGMYRVVKVGRPRLEGQSYDDDNNDEEETGETRETREEERFVILDILEFTSKRKRQSVIVMENPREVKAGVEEPKIRVYCKGADNVIFERLDNERNDSEIIQTTNQHLSSYAEDGLRTLAIATVELKIEEYNEWKLRYEKIMLDEEEEAKRKAQMPNKIDDIADEIEQNLILIGATAIEDKLQDGVPDAVADLAKAGIKVWVLTGDKQETAINIGFATQLLRRDMDRTMLNGVRQHLEVTQQMKAGMKAGSNQGAPSAASGQGGQGGQGEQGGQGDNGNSKTESDDQEKVE